MYVSERCCSPPGSCAYQDGDRGLGSWRLSSGALQSDKQSLRESWMEPGGVGPSSCAVHQLPCTVPAQPRSQPPLLTACGWVSCSEDCIWPAWPPGFSLPGASDPGPRSAWSALLCPCRRTTSSDGPCHQGMGAPVLAVPAPSSLQTVPESLCSLFSFEGSCRSKGHEVLKPGAQMGGYWKQELGSVVCLSPALNIFSSVPCRSWTASLSFMGGSHWLARHIARPSLGLRGLPKI